MKTAVVGSINMDMTVTAERIPLKGETLKGEDIRYIPGGKGANQAVAMAKLGADVEMFGCVGGDEAGRSLIKNMEDMGVGTTHIKVAPGVNTGLAVITVGDHDNTIVVVAGANDKVDREYVDSIRDALLACDIVLLQHEIPQDTIEYVIDICHENGVKVVLNPGPARPVKPEVLAKVDYLTPNEHEAAILFGDMPVGDAEGTSRQAGDYPGFQRRIHMPSNGRNTYRTSQESQCGGYHRSRGYTKRCIYRRDCGGQHHGGSAPVCQHGGQPVH